MSKNMSSTNSQWESAYDQYSNLQNRASSAADKYTGNAGYENSLTEAAKGANIRAQAAGDQATQAARSAGMSKAAAANLGAQQTAQGYGSGFDTQQQNALASGSNAVSAANQAVSNQSGALNSSQTEGNNRYNRAWGNTGFITGTIGSLLSDERLKSYKKITSEVFAAPKVEPKISDLIWKQKETK